MQACLFNLKRHTVEKTSKTINLNSIQHDQYVLVLFLFFRNSYTHNDHKRQSQH